ncbi:helix-turn-helix domain-containing protein [Vreelandella venusta]|uniref:helix-turn-helix domain-containing protein n=1 Tax=Vreelandella venusta TaxID=44935 RepID=UPI003C2ACA7D
MQSSETLGKRLKKLMNEHGINDSELAKRSGVPQSSIHRLVHDKTKSPKYDNVTRLAHILGVSADYLIHGIQSSNVVQDGSQEENLGSGMPPNLIGAAIANRGFLASKHRGILKDLNIREMATMIVDGPLIDALKSLKKPSRPHLPPAYLYPHISWLEAKHSDYLKDFAFLSKKDCAYSNHAAEGLAFWLTMRGDAMAAPMGQTPTLPEGVNVLFDTGKRIKPDTIVLAMLPAADTLTCRLLVEEAGERLLRPLNPSYPMTQVNDDTLLIATAIESKSII